jgi:hypothetical protein
MRGAEGVGRNGRGRRREGKGKGGVEEKEVKIRAGRNNKGVCKAERHRKENIEPEDVELKSLQEKFSKMPNVVFFLYQNFH